MSDDEQTAGQQAADFMRAVTKLARQHNLSTGQTVNCFGYLARLMGQSEGKRRGIPEPQAMTKYIHAFMTGLGAECQFSVEGEDGSVTPLEHPDDQRGTLQ